jgi:hypothetical protein
MGNFVNSIFTPRGTNARRAQEADQAKVSGGYQELFDMLMPHIKEQISFGSRYEPMRQAEIRRQLMLASPGNDEARKRMYANSVFGNAVRSANTQNALNRAAGFSGAYGAGQRTAMLNSAADASNRFNLDMNSPETMLARSQLRMGALNQSQSVPGFNMLGNAASGVYGRPSVHVDQGIGGSLGSLAGLAGSLLGGGGGAALGAAGGGINASSTNPFNNISRGGG